MNYETAKIFAVLYSISEGKSGALQLTHSIRRINWLVRSELELTLHGHKH